MSKAADGLQKMLEQFGFAHPPPAIEYKQPGPPFGKGPGQRLPFLDTIVLQ
ncbi:MAG: hypothetical protein KIS61_19775 [Candidatus Eremiobacteraeota bacterium]|nr:hypothetical protein [Candidatus Eremiobacteraeota bacterium]